MGMGMGDSASVQAPEVAAALGQKATMFKFGTDVGAGEHCQI